MPGADTLVFVRGGALGRGAGVPNPRSLPDPPRSEVFTARWAGGDPHSVGEGSDPLPSPDGERLAFLRDGRVCTVSLDADGEAEPLFQARGRVGDLAWSPNGARLAFVSDRGDHAFVGAFDRERRAIDWLDPGVDRDGAPVWSPSGRHVAFLRIPRNERLPFTPRREAQPWSIRVVDIETGSAHDAFVAAPGRGSAFRGIEAPALRWCAGDLIVFPWERDGWTHL